MFEPWNDSSILPPPIHTFPCESNNDANELTYICNNIIKVLSKQSPLHQETTIFSRLVYKFDKKFRNDVGYRNFKKVNTALRKYMSLNLLKDIENYLSVLPSSYDDLYLPTRQMLEYVLVRLLTFSKLMMRIYVCSKRAAVFYLDRVKRGEGLWMSLMPYSILSRVWSISKVLLQYCCGWYSQLYSFLDKLQLKGLPFLPNDYKLPVDLEKWLDMKNLDNFGRFNWSLKKNVDIDPNLADDGEDDTFDSLLKYVEQINDNEVQCESEIKCLPKKLNDNVVHTFEIKNVDQGEAISRESYKAMLMLGDHVSVHKNIRKSDNYSHSATYVTNKNSLGVFITKEETFRNESNDKSLTSHLSFMQWQALKNSLMKLHNSLSNNRKIERKFQKIWREKCLDYC